MENVKDRGRIVEIHAADSVFESMGWSLDWLDGASELLQFYEAREVILLEFWKAGPE